MYSSEGRQENGSREVAVTCYTVNTGTLAKALPVPSTNDCKRLLNVLEVIAPFKHFNKLREFVQMKLPPGFPVKLDIPVFPTITATVTFQEFRYDEFDESIFTVPDDYKEDPSRFPDL
uniref:Ankyrin repeat domain-containing protein 13C n=1 Tax=Sphaerodactylus townsendi TaxID=933632 RepID=A0ACB8F3R1_9SAUR